MFIFKISILVIVFSLIGLVIYNSQTRKKMNISSSDYYDIKRKSQNKVISKSIKVFLILLIILWVLFVCSLIWMFVLVFGLPATAAIAGKSSFLIVTVSKTLICELYILLLLLIVRQILIAKYLNKMKENNK